MGEVPELIEDYCIRAGRVHPWASQAGHEIKALKKELTQLRKQFAREHAACEAFFTDGVSSVTRSIRPGCGKFFASNNVCGKYADDPVAAVLAVVEATASEGGE